MDIKLLKECGIEAIKDSLLHVLDRACLLLFAFAMGMLAYTLMYGTGAFYIMVLCAMVCVGIILARTFLHSAMVHVRYPLVLYLKKEKGYAETYSIHQLDTIAYLCETAISILFILVLSLWCGLLMAVLFFLAVVLAHLSCAKCKDDTIRLALQDGITTAVYFITFTIMVLFIRNQDVSADSALSILLAMLFSMPQVSIKENILFFFYSLSFPMMACTTAIVVLQLFQLLEIPVLYLDALLCFLCIGPACFVAAMHLWKPKKERKLFLSALVLAIPVIFIVSDNLFSLLMGVFVIVARLFLLPAMSATFSKGLEEKEEDDDEEIYALLQQQSDAPGVFASMFTSVLFVAGMTLLYLRGMVTYVAMLMGMMAVIGYMHSPSVSLAALQMKEMVQHHLHQS